MADIMQNTDGFATMHDQPVNNDKERMGAPKKGHGYTGKGYGGGRDQTRPLPSTPYQQGRTVVGESDGYGNSDPNAKTTEPGCEGTPYTGDKNAKGGFAKKTGYGEL